MKFRSILFVPADRPERFEKAMNSAADALILDLEDSVSAEKKAYARSAVREFLATPHEKPVTVRVNSVDSSLIEDDLSALEGTAPDGVVLPKAEGSRDVKRLDELYPGSMPPVLPVATETPAAIFELGSFREVSHHLLALTWGAEDLPAAIGASTARNEDGSYTSPYQLARDLTLFAAHAANTPAIETIYPNFRDDTGLSAYAKRGRIDGFTGMMAIHPNQCAIINEAFMPSEDEIQHAERILKAAEQHAEIGAFQLDGQMIDAPHLKQARRILELTDRS